jgi:hypothetical protein
MFSYLRPHHRRSPSNPTSPAEQSHSFEPPLRPNSPLDHGHPQRYQDAESKNTNAQLSPLPPIARVSSAESNLESSRRKGYEGEPRNQHWDALRNSTRPRDINTHSNHQRIPPYAGAQRPESAGNAAGSNYSSSQYTRSQAGTSQDRPKPLGSNQQFVTAADLQNKPIQSGRRPAGARLPTPPPSASNQVSTFEPVQPKSGKARLNLLNPMSLLARRRTSHAVPQLSSEALVSNRGGSAFSETYDFQIKGKFVHDFSAPRAPRRNISYNDARAQENDPSKQYQRSPNLQKVESNTADETPASPWSGGNHTPVFTENFEEEQYPAAGPHVRKASDLTDLPLPRPPYAQGSRKPVDSNSAPKSVEGPPKQGHTRKLSDRKPVPDIGPAVPPKAEGDTSSEPRRISIDPASTPPKSTASSKKGRSRNVSVVSAKEGTPKHMKSTSSRFSFDMIGAAEQERLLEDRHRQRALEKRNGNADGDERLDDEFDDDFDYDNMMDDDGLEERIPGVNAELEENDYDDDGGFEERIPGINTDLDMEDDFENAALSGQNLGGFTFQQPSASPLSPYSPNYVSTPRDANGEVIGFAMTKESPYIPQVNVVQDSTSSPAPLDTFDAETFGIDQGLEGLGLQGIDIPHSIDPDVQLEMQDEETDGFPQADGLDDDDLYFDDGIIGGPGDADDAVEFDESVFDHIDTDEYGRPLKPLSSLPTLYSPPMLTADPSPSFNNIMESAAEAKDDIISPGTIVPSGNLAPQPSVAVHSNSLAQTQTLTQDTLAAYQSALAAAAHYAAASGKFRRDSTSTFQPKSEQELEEEPHPGLIPDSSQTSHYEAFSPSYELEDDFDYDDALEDDAIIAAANAEALANDSDGFYGQEFGFYSAPAAGEAEYANGGYFGPRGVEGINRSTSGRVVSREPNLTPITERSEYSNRNSFMGLSMNRPESLTSPGLAQLAGMMRREDYEGDLSLDALLKLRRGAWGGSQASLHSSNGSPRSAGLDEGSPVGGLPPWSAGSQFSGGTGQQAGYMRRNSGFSGTSVVSDISLNTGTNLGNGKGRRNSTGMAMEIGPKSEDSSSPASPTLNMAFSISALEPTSATSMKMASPISAIDSSASVSRGGSNNSHIQGKDDKERDKEKLRRHRYTGSAESISYLKEDDPISGERWILERRRTGEGGEVEVLGREVVSGGRI